MVLAVRIKVAHAGDLLPADVAADLMRLTGGLLEFELELKQRLWFEVLLHRNQRERPLDHDEHVARVCRQVLLLAALHRATVDIQTVGALEPCTLYRLLRLAGEATGSFVDYLLAVELLSCQLPVAVEQQVQKRREHNL